MKWQAHLDGIVRDNVDMCAEKRFVETSSMLLMIFIPLAWVAVSTF